MVLTALTLSSCLGILAALASYLAGASALTTAASYCVTAAICFALALWRQMGRVKSGNVDFRQEIEADLEALAQTKADDYRKHQHAKADAPVGHFAAAHNRDR